MKRILIAAVLLLGAASFARAQEDQTHTGDFHFPPGDAAAGRKAFTELGCVSCHRVARDTALSAPIGDIQGPTLDFPEGTPSPQITQAIISPSHTIAEGFGEGTPEDVQRSPMLDLSDRMTIRQLRDILSYLKSMERTD